MTLTYKHTRSACNLGIICQAVNNNLPPLLFIIFQSRYGLTYDKLASLILMNFLTQLATDIVAARYVDRIGYRIPMVLAHAYYLLGLALFAAAPFLPIPIFGALATGIVVSAIGGGLTEVLVSPISDALPAEEEKKAANMALLHSFYCWGSVAVVLLSTLFLAAVGNGYWQLLPLFWCVLPLLNLFLCARVPFIPAPLPEKQTGLRKLFATPAFWAAMILMVCAGASELVIAQWSSLFAEQGLGLSKVMGDLAGPCLFAVMMGIGRTAYGLWGAKLRLVRAISLAAVLCIMAYLLASLAPHPVLNLLGCALCGFAVSIMWPGATSLSAARFPRGGTALFGILAMCGDLGCAAGPGLAGFIAGRATAGGLIQSLSSALFQGGNGGLKMGILLAAIFPLAMLIALPLFRRGGNREEA